jgi:hypothetical protein
MSQGLTLGVELIKWVLTLLLLTLLLPITHYSDDVGTAQKVFGSNLDSEKFPKSIMLWAGEDLHLHAFRH